MTKVVVLFLVTLLCACSSSTSVPENILPPNRMKELVFDMARADEFVNSYVMRDTSLKPKEQHIKMYEQVFLIHKTNHDEFYRSFKYYQEHPDLNKALFDSINVYSKKLQGKQFQGRDTTHK